MRKQYSVFIFFITLAILFIQYSCRKTDQSSSEVAVTVMQQEDKFFTAHRSGDPAEQALVDFVKRKNNKEHFVETTIRRVGYPRWDKTIVRTKPGALGRGATDSSETVYYIPFVRDSQNYVNASMVLRTSAGDTTLSYKCDWQYSGIQNGHHSVSDSAEYYAIFFMALDKNVFGHTRFAITDTNLFRQNNHKPLFIELDSAANSTGTSKRSSFTRVCENVTIYIIDCTYPGHPNCTPVCDGCWECTSFITYQYCWEEYLGEGGAGGGGSSGGTGGGGTGGGGFVPPDCGGMPAARGTVVQGCEPGWYPPDDVNNIPYVLENLAVNAPHNSQPVNLIEYLQCFTNTPGSVYKVTISADQPVPGKSDCWTYGNNGGIDVGHTFLTLEQTKPDGTKIIRSFGFYPTGQVKPVSPSSSGNFINDQGHISDASLTTTITDGGFFMQNINNLKAMPVPGYDLSFNNCTTFATFAMAGFGIIIPLQSCFWASFGNPGDLGQFIRNLQLAPNQTRNTTTTTAPVNAGGC